MATHKFLIVVEIDSVMTRDLVAKGLKTEVEEIWLWEPVHDAAITAIHIGGEHEEI